MKYIRITSTYVLTLLAFSIPAFAEVTDRHEIVIGSIPNPAHIWVYDFSATSSDIPPESALAVHTADSSSAQTQEQLAAGRKLGREIADELVRQIRTMGLSADRANSETKIGINDAVIHGHLISLDAGEQKKRVLIGFGAGESELKAATEGFQMTNEGLRRLGSAKINEAGGFVGKTPGVAVGVVGTVATHNPLGLIVSTGVKTHQEKSDEGKLAGRAKDTGKEIAEMLKPRFREAGWIE